MSSNLHHRRARSNGGTKNRPKGNCVKVDCKKHYFWHCLFGNMTGAQIANELNTLWLDPAFKVVPRKLFNSK